METAVADI